MITNRHYQQGQHLMSLGRHSEAAREFQAYLAEDPDNGVVHSLMALCQLELNHGPQALDTAKKAIVCEPTTPYCHYVLAFVLRHLKKFKEAKAAIKEAIELDPDDADFHLEFSTIALINNEMKEALQHSETAVELAPDDANCLMQHSWILLHANKLTEAEKVLEEAIRYEPNSARAHAIKGWLALERKKPAQAIAAFRDALRISPSNSWARDGLLTSLRSRNPLYWVMLNLMWVKDGWRPWFFGSYAAVAFVVWGIFQCIGIICSWVNPYLLNVVLRFDPVARGALYPEEVWVAERLAMWLGGGYILLLLLLVFAGFSPVFAPTFWFVYGVPLLAVRYLEFPEPEYRRKYLIYLATAVGVGGLSILCSAGPDFINNDREPWGLVDVSGICLNVFLVMCVMSRAPFMAHAKAPL